MSKEESDKTNFGAYDHLKKEVAEKNGTTKSGGASRTGVPMVMKVFLLGLIIFGGLMASGVLTGPGPFGGGGPDDSQYQGEYIPEGEINNEGIADMCVSHGGVSQHYHYEVRILVDGTPQDVPANIGITSDCMKPIHTHDAGGKVHVELPSSFSGNSPNIGDFFEIWGYSFSSNQVLGQNGDVTMTVNSEEKSGNIQFYIPQDNDFIQISLTT